MMEPSVSVYPICGVIDRSGRLLDADPPLAALHIQTGGRPGGTVAIPQLAALARLVMRLQVPVSRPVAAADNGTDIDLFVNARPRGEQILIEIVDWTTRPALSLVRDMTRIRQRDFARARSDFSWAVDVGLTVTELSTEAAAALGSTVEAVLGQPFTQLFSLFEGPDGMTPMLKAVAARNAFENQQARLRGTDYGLLYLSGSPHFDAQKRFMGYRGTALRVRPQDMLDEEDVAFLAEADESFGTEIGRVLKAPIDRIIANADIIRHQGDGPLRRGYADYAADIAAAGRHLMALVDDLVELQTIERPEFHPEAEPIDLCDIARRAAGLLAVRAADSKVTIDRPGEDESIMATGEFRRVLQILVNLLGNAVRHSPTGGSVWLRAERDGDNAVLIVADQGPGIAPENQEKAFEKFERLGWSGAAGSGLGLYISRRLARAMHGDLVVDSAPGQGARFIFTLPARD